MAAAKAEGLPVTCEVTPHHMFLTEDAITAEYQTALKVNPPLRTAEDAAALIEGLANGTIDAIVTDHAPHTDWEKDREFELAPFGMTGLETSLSLVLTHLVRAGVIDYGRMIQAMAVAPREILRQEPVKIQAGSVADLTVIDPEAAWTVEVGDLLQGQQLRLHRSRALWAAPPTSTSAAMPPWRTARSSSSACRQNNVFAWKGPSSDGPSRFPASRVFYRRTSAGQQARGEAREERAPA